MVAENVRFIPIHDHGKAIIERGEIGESFMLITKAEIYAAAAKFQGPHTGWRSDPAKIGGGVMLTTGIHSLSLARSLMGEIESVFAMEGERTRKEIPVENTMHVLLNFESGATGQGSFSWATTWFNDKMDTTIFGTKGIIGLDIPTDLLWLEKGNERTTWVEHSDGPYQGQWRLIKHFVDCIDHDKTPATSGVEETRSLRVVLAAYQSARKRTIIRIDDVS